MRWLPPRRKYIWRSGSSDRGVVVETILFGGALVPRQFHRRVLVQIFGESFAGAAKLNRRRFGFCDRRARDLDQGRGIPRFVGVFARVVFLLGKVFLGLPPV